MIASLGFTNRHSRTYSRATLRNPSTSREGWSGMTLIDTRRSQMFPVLSPAQIETAKRFASREPQRVAPGELIFEVGERQAPAWLVLEGSIEVSRHDGRGRELPITVEGAGQFSGEVSQLAGRPSLATGRAGPAG
jgi:thioredoxin reductase (NADPH)